MKPSKTSIVAYYKGGFSVALFDLDVNAAVGCKIFAEYEAAVEYAKGLVA